MTFSFVQLLWWRWLKLTKEKKEMIIIRQKQQRVKVIDKTISKQDSRQDETEILPRL